MGDTQNEAGQQLKNSEWTLSLNLRLFFYLYGFYYCSRYSNKQCSG